MSNPQAAYHPHPSESPGERGAYGGHKRPKLERPPTNDSGMGAPLPGHGGPPPPGYYHGHQGPPPPQFYAPAGQGNSPGGGQHGIPSPGGSMPGAGPPPGYYPGPHHSDPYFSGGRGPPPPAYHDYPTGPSPPGAHHHYGAPPHQGHPPGTPSPRHHYPHGPSPGGEPRSGSSGGVNYPPRAHLPPRFSHQYDYDQRPTKAMQLQHSPAGASSPGEDGGGNNDNSPTSVTNAPSNRTPQQQQQPPDTRSPEGSRNLNNFEERVPSSGGGVSGVKVEDLSGPPPPPQLHRPPSTQAQGGSPSMQQVGSPQGGSPHGPHSQVPPPQGPPPQGPPPAGIPLTPGAMPRHYGHMPPPGVPPGAMPPGMPMHHPHHPYHAPPPVTSGAHTGAHHPGAHPVYPPHGHHPHTNPGHPAHPSHAHPSHAHPSLAHPSLAHPGAHPQAAHPYHSHPGAHHPGAPPGHPSHHHPSHAHHPGPQFHLTPPGAPGSTPPGGMTPGPDGRMMPPGSHPGSAGGHPGAHQGTLHHLGGPPPGSQHHPGAPPGSHPGHPGGPHEVWPCDYCGLKFANWEDCSAHESTCPAAAQAAAYGQHPGGMAGPHTPRGAGGPPLGMGGGMGMGPGGAVGRNPRNRSLKGRKMVLASFPNQGHLLMDEDAEFAQNEDRDTYLLSTPADGESLSDRQCYVRSHFVELFIATSTDVSARHSRGAQKLHLNQIGLRCAYCVKLKPRDRAERAICYPSSISRIYQTVADMQRFHFESCVAIPPKVLHTYKSLKTTRPRGVGSPQSYWDKSAREIGLVDTAEGIQVNVEEGGDKKLEGQKKSAVTGMLERMGGVVQGQQLQGHHPGQDQALQHDMSGHMQGQGLPQGQFIQDQVQVKEERVEVRGPQDQSMAQAPAPTLVAGAAPAVVVSSPGSENASKDEDDRKGGACPSTPAASKVASKLVETTMTTPTSNVEAEEDANILLMLKKTPESPPRNATSREEGEDEVADKIAAV